MKIAFVTFEYPPMIIGGAGVYAKNITIELAKLGHEIVVFTPFYDRREQKLPNLHIHEVKIRINLFKALQFWQKLPKEVKLYESCNGKFDVIHFNGLSYGFFKKRLSQSIHTITIHHPVKDSIESNGLNIFQRFRDISGENGFVMPLIESRCISIVDHIFSVSMFTKTQIIKQYGLNPDKIKVVYNGFDHMGLNISEKEIETIRSKYHLPKKNIILFLGRINDPRKGLDLLIESFKEFYDKIDVTLLVVGSGTPDIFKKGLPDEILENIVFTGFVVDEEIKNLYALCDLYVSPSRLEGFGITVLEALSAGKPVIATNVGSIPEIAKVGHVCLVEPNKAHELAESIKNFFCQKNDRNEYITNIKLDGLQDFSWENAAMKLSDQWRRMINDKNQ